MKKGRLGATLAAIVLLCSRPVAAQIGTVTVTGGRVQGVSVDGVTSFKGIPFAAPPVRDLRWRDPRPVQPWQGVKQADRFGPACMQNPATLQRFAAPPALSEDCLYLNVWTAARSAREKRPVIVWIYGGGFSSGATSTPIFDGTHFARLGVVLVSVAYRVGTFGFLAHPELSREQGGTSGNYGLSDMIHGLKWVKANAARFGGDPTNVTIMGESASGIAASMLAASPAAKGLFERVICQSGSNFAPPRSSPLPLGTSALPGAAGEGGQLWQSLAGAEQYGADFIARLGAKNLAEARRVPAEVIQKAFGLLPPYSVAPVFDGRLLPGDEYALYEQRRFIDTPVLLGTNSDEGFLFVGPGMSPAQLGITPARLEDSVRADFDGSTDALLALYPHATDAEALQAARDLFRDSVFGWGTWSWARLQTRYGRNQAYLYYFDLRTARAPHGAPHGTEGPYVFGNDPGGGASGLQGQSARPEDQALSDLIMRYWVNFARTGDPNGPGLPVWPAFSDSNQQALFLDEHPGAQPVPNLQQLEVLDRYFAARRKEANKQHGS